MTKMTNFRYANADPRLVNAAKRAKAFGGDALGLGGGLLGLIGQASGATDMWNKGEKFLQSTKDLGAVVAGQAPVIAGNALSQYANRLDEKADLGTPLRPMTPVPSRQAILAQPIPEAHRPQRGSSPMPAPAAMGLMPDAHRPRRGSSPMPAEMADPAAAVRARASSDTSASGAPSPVSKPEQPRQPASVAEVIAGPSVRGGGPDPDKQRSKKDFKHSPLGMGLMAYGLTILGGGGDVQQALENGMAMHDRFASINDDKDRKKQAEALAQSVPEEYRDAAIALASSGDLEGVADLQLGATQATKEEAEAKARTAALAGAVAQVYPDIDQAALSAMDPSTLSGLLMGSVDLNDAMKLAQYKASLAPSGGTGGGMGLAGVEFNPLMMTPEFANLSETEQMIIATAKDPSKVMNEMMTRSADAADHDRKYYERVTESTDRMVGAVDRAISAISVLQSDIIPDTARGMQAGANAFPGGKAAQVRDALDTVKALIGFDELQKMRDNSPTGGALGQVAVMELQMLQATLGNLKWPQDLEVIQGHLERIKQQSLAAKSKMQAGYNDVYGRRQAQPQAQPVRARNTAGDDWFEQDGVRIRVVQ